MNYPLRRKLPQWRRVRGRRIHGVLFEIDVQRGRIRFRRGRKVEVLDLAQIGLTIDNQEKMTYNKEHSE